MIIENLKVELFPATSIDHGCACLLRAHDDQVLNVDV